MTDYKYTITITCPTKHGKRSSVTHGRTGRNGSRTRLKLRRRQSVSTANREYFEDWQRELSRDPGYQQWLADMAIADNRGNEMNINEVFPSKYIKCSDLGGRKLKVTIRGVSVESVGKKEGREDNKPVLYFAGKEKGLVLNKTKAGILAGAFSPETEGWIGKEVAIFPTRVMFGDQMVDSIGIEPVLPMVDADLNDEVPF